MHKLVKIRHRFMSLQGNNYFVLPYLLLEINHSILLATELVTWKL